MIHGKPLLLMAWAWLSLFSVEAAVSPNSEVLFHKRHVYVKNGQQTIVDSVNIQINNKYGEEQVTVPYDKIFKLKRFKAWIQDSKGNVLGVFPKAAFEDRNRYQETSLYDDQRERVCSTHYPNYPFQFCYTSTVVSKSIFHLAQWEPFSYQSKPLHSAELWIHRPVDYPVRSLLKGLVEIRTETIGKQVITRYRMKPVNVTVEAMQNPTVVKTPNFVWVVPEQINYGVQGLTSSWSEFGNWVDELNKGLTKLPENEMHAARTLILGVSDTVSMIRKLYHYMQDHTRYVSIQLGIGGMKSYPAKYVSINKFGDCKALSMYMKALLECVGIESHLVLIERDEYPDLFYPEFPASQFNHMILAVPVGKDTLWLENTSSNGAMGYVDITTQNRQALWVDGKKSRLVSIPILDLHALAGSRFVKVNCNPDGDATISIRQLGRGWEYEHMNSLNKDVSAKSQYSYLDRFIIFKHYEMVRFEFLPVNRDSMYALMDIQFNMPRFLQGDTEHVFLPQIPVYQGSIRFFKPDNQSVLLTYSVCETDTVHYQLSENMKLENVPDSFSVSCPFGRFSSVFYRNGSTLVGIKTYFIQSGTYDPTAYRTLYDFIQKVTEYEKKTIVIKT